MKTDQYLIIIRHPNLKTIPTDEPFKDFTNPLIPENKNPELEKIPAILGEKNWIEKIDYVMIDDSARCIQTALPLMKALSSKQINRSNEIEYHFFDSVMKSIPEKVLNSKKCIVWFCRMEGIQGLIDTEQIEVPSLEDSNYYENIYIFKQHLRKNEKGRFDKIYLLDNDNPPLSRK